MATSFLKELEQLANPAPLREDDDHEDEATTARVVDKGSLLDDDADSGEGGQLQNRLLRRGVILAEEDERYSGAVVSRSMLDSDEDDEAEDRSADDVDESASEGGEPEDEEEGNGEDDEQDEQDEQQEESEESEDVVAEQEDNDSTGLMKLFSGVDMREENAKGRAVQAQIKLWEQLLGARIRFQRVLALINQLPQTDDDWQNLCNELQTSTDSDAKKQIDEWKSHDECRRILKSTLDEFINVQDQLLKRNNVLESSASTTTNQTGDGDDDEVLSSPDEDDDRKAGADERKKPKKRRFTALDDYSNFLEERHAALKVFRDQTILKWFEKTRLATGRFAWSSFSAFENNALQQIEQILSDRDRLIKRTQLKRSTYTILGKRRRKDDNANSQETDQEYDEEIFDDDDFYQQLLRELIERRTLGVTDPVALSRQWLELQKLRSKSKKKQVDRKASKGRRCRYDVVPKLVNFMAPIDHCPMTDEAREELFQSLFQEHTI